MDNLINNLIMVYLFAPWQFQKKYILRKKIPVTALIGLCLMLWTFDGWARHDNTNQPPGTSLNLVDTAAYATSPETNTIEQDTLRWAEGVNEANNNTIAIEAGESKNTERSRLREEIIQPPEIGNVVSLTKIFWTLVFIMAGFLLMRTITGLFNLVAHRHPRRKTVIRRLLPILKIIGWSLVVYIIITLIIQPPKETVFAFFASIGVAIGFASQDFLKNIFGGLMILFDKPFQIGDKIESGKYYGEVHEIGLRSTRVVTPDDSVVTIPNSEMMNQSISNANSGTNNCQVVAELYLPINIDTGRVRQIATEAAQVSKYVYLNKPIMVEYSNVLVPKGSFLKMRLKAYVMDVKYEFPFQSEMTEIVLRELYKGGLLKTDI